MGNSTFVRPDDRGSGVFLSSKPALDRLVGSSPPMRKLPGVHVVNCIGKATIALFARILNHFKKPYTAIHDSDSPEAVRRDGTKMKNPAWTNNRLIFDEVMRGRASGVDARVVASVPDFERCYLGYESTGDKPWRAWTRVREDAAARARIAELVESLIEGRAEREYRDVEQLERWAGGGRSAPPRLRPAAMLR